MHNIYHVNLLTNNKCALRNDYQRTCWSITNLLGEIVVVVEVLLCVHKNRRLIRDGSPGRPPRLSHSSWTLNLAKCIHAYLYIWTQFYVQLPFLYTAWSNAYSEIGPEVRLRPLATSCAKDYKGHSLMQTSFTEPPNRLQRCSLLPITSIAL